MVLTSMMLALGAVPTTLPLPTLVGTDGATVEIGAADPWAAPPEPLRPTVVIVPVGPEGDGPEKVLSAAQVVKVSEKAEAEAAHLAVSGAAAASTARSAAPARVATPVVEVTPVVNSTTTHGSATPLSRSDAHALSPKRVNMEPSPYAQTDFTAYTLELGETRVGLGSVAVGVMPRVQVGTQAAADVLGALNANVKADLLRLGPIDFAVQGGLVSYRDDEMAARYLRGGLASSARLSSHASLHGGVSYASLYAGGTPNLDVLATPFTWVAGWRPTDEAISQAEDRLDFEGTAKVVTARVAADYRFNRRDSLILQGQSMVWGESNFPVEIPATVTGGDPVAPESSGWMSVTDAYVASLSYQASFRNFDVRVGFGTSSLPGAWLLQATELAWRFGGETRRAEARVARELRQRDQAVAEASRSTSSGGRVPEPSALSAR